MKKAKTFRRVRFDTRTFFELDKALGPENKYSILAVDLEDAEWYYDTFEEFLAATDQGEATLSGESSKGKRTIWVQTMGDVTNVKVSAPTRSEIESIFSVFEKNAERCRLPEEPDEEEVEAPPKIFIGHGGDPQWRDLKDHLHEKHEYAIEAYEIGSREGHAIRDILEEMLEESSLALLVMTGEDETKGGGAPSASKRRARGRPLSGKTRFQPRNHSPRGRYRRVFEHRRASTDQVFQGQNKRELR